MPAQNMAVPPYVSQMQSAIANSNASVLLQTLSFDWPMPWTSSLLFRAIKDEASASSPAQQEVNIQQAHACQTKAHQAKRISNVIREPKGRGVSGIEWS